MCLITLQITPNIATEDITCYKVLTKDLKSPCYGQQYVLGILIKSDLNHILRNNDFQNNRVEEGLHTFRFPEYAVRKSKTCWKVQNAWTHKNGVCGRIVVECVIPKGSQYYIDVTDNEYASNQLIPKEIVYIRE